MLHDSTYETSRTAKHQSMVINIIAEVISEWVVDLGGNVGRFLKC
jgi:hypothetical protein